MRSSRYVLAMFVVMLLGGGLFTARGANAQESEATAGETGTRSATAASDLQAVAPRGGALEEERDPGRGPRPPAPVLLEPAATTTEHTRFGLSTWIAPGAPFEHRENPGGIVIGFSIGRSAPARVVPSSGPSPWRGSAAR